MRYLILIFLQNIFAQDNHNNEIMETNLKLKLSCPSSKNNFHPFFSLHCKKDSDCQIWGKLLICCDNRCVKGVLPSTSHIKHTPILFGLIERSCPSLTIPEIFDIKKCKNDFDCHPRICCPEIMVNGDIQHYCRTATPHLDKLPQQFVKPLQTFMSYIKCTQPPPLILDFFPKSCKNSWDCFPNLCCQERGKKVCRPPQKSVFSLIAAASRV